MLKSFFAIIAAISLAGCATSRPIQQATIEVVPGSIELRSNSVNKVGLVVGLTRVQPQYWGGWNGSCPGSDVDIRRMGDFLTSRSVQHVVLYNEEATIANVTRIASQLAVGLKSNDLFVVYYSGHGGQVRDFTGEEEDGKNETFCLSDGEMTDDVVGGMLVRLPNGIRVWFVTDSCNSRTNYRARRSLEGATHNFNGQLIHLGGCEDGKSALGDRDGGVMTSVFFDALDEETTYGGACNDIKAIFPKEIDQIVVESEWGNVTEEFRNTPVGE